MLTFCFLLQSLCLLQLSCEVEGRAATLRQEALQCLTIALAGSSAVGLSDLIKTFFGSPEDDQHVWDFVDPKSKIAKPLELYDMESEDKAEDVTKPSSSKASTSKRSSARSKKSQPPPEQIKVKKVQRVDVADDITETVRIIPFDEDSLALTGIPAHLKAPRQHKTSSSGASLYYCPHPKCDPIFIAKGGPSPLYNHMRRHHLGISLLCPYCPAKLIYTSGGWSTYIRNCHSKVPWYKSQVRDVQDEQQEAEDLLEKIEADPTSLSSQARHQDTILLEAFEEDKRIVVPRDVKEEDLETIQEDIDFPEETEVVRPKPPSPTHGFIYAGSVNPDGHQIRYRVKRSLESEEEEGQSKKPKKDK